MPRSLTRCDEETNTASNGNRILATSVTELSRLITCGSEPALKTFLLPQIYSGCNSNSKSTLNYFKYIHFNILLR
jgi:hypothetical protein